MQDNQANCFEAAIAAFTKLLGSDRVILEDLSLSHAATATFETKQRVSAILYPENVSELQICVQIANQQKVAMYTVSRGKNWGYGSRVPYHSNSVLISLERMDSILEYNEKLGYVTIEAGVSFGQLSCYLDDNESQFIIDAPGSTPEASVVGNTLERGFAQGQYGERSHHIAGMEIVLPTGEIIQTGMSAFRNSNTAALHPQETEIPFSIFLPAIG